MKHDMNRIDKAYKKGNKIAGNLLKVILKRSSLLIFLKFQKKLNW